MHFDFTPNTRTRRDRYLKEVFFRNVITYGQYGLNSDYEPLALVTLSKVLLRGKHSMGTDDMSPRSRRLSVLSGLTMSAWEIAIHL